MSNRKKTYTSLQLQIQRNGNGEKKRKPIHNAIQANLQDEISQIPNHCWCQCVYTLNPNAPLSGWLDMFSAWMSYVSLEHLHGIDPNPYPPTWGDECTDNSQCRDLCDDVCLNWYKNPESLSAGQQIPWQLDSYKCERSDAWLVYDWFGE